MKFLLFLQILIGSGLVLNAQVICDGQLGDNTISNGDFGSGIAPIQTFDPSYAPNYIYQANTAPTEGQYTIAHTTLLPNNDCWINTNDNGDENNGYFMLVNTKSEAGSIIYQRTLEVCDGIPYLLSVDLINLRNNGCNPVGSVPNIDLLVDGQAVLTTGNLMPTGAWVTFSQLIDIPTGVDLITITLRNNTPGGIGNDIGIDNLSLRHCGPMLILPATSFVCPDGGSIALNHASVDYPSPYFQWQQSFDGGGAWVDLPNENSNTLEIVNPNTGIYYRIMVANGPINFLSENCRATSNATRLEVREPVEIFRTPVICEGDTVSVGEDAFTESGQYSTLIAGDSGCDSLIHTQVFTLPVYEQRYTQSLCFGDSFEGEALYSDTLISRALISSQGCDSTIHYEISVFSVADLSINGETQLCAGDSTQLAVNASYPQYQWNTGAQTATIAVQQAGEYTLSVVNSQGCTSSTSTTVTVSNPFMETLAEAPSCPDTEDGRIEVLFQSGGIAPYSFRLEQEGWGTVPVFENLPAGEYTVYLSDALECESSQVVIIEETEPLDITLNGLPNAGVEAGDSLQLQVISAMQGLTYSWSGDGLFDCQNCATTTWAPLQGGELRIAVQNAAGCSRIIDTTIAVRDPVRVYIPNAFSPNNDGINDTFFPAVDSNVKSIDSWSIYDRWGGRMFHKGQSSPHDPALGWDGRWRGQLQNNGVYIYRAEISFNNGRTKIFAGEVYLE